MSPNNLALIFAPCILRSNQSVHAQEQLRDVNRQAICVQALIEEKLKQYKSTLTQIVTLEGVGAKVCSKGLLNLLLSEWLISKDVLKFFLCYLSSLPNGDFTYF